MIVMAANPSNTIALAPPLMVGKDEIEEAITILDQALEVTDRYATT